MKFRHAIYISFHGDMNGTGSETKKSYFYQKDKNLEREYTIKMHSDHKRKALLNHEIPFVRINFPYDEDYFNKKLAISSDCRNYEIAEKLMAKELKNIQPYSRIYISAYSVSKRSIQQLIKLPGHDNLENVSIQASDIVSILSKHIPNLSKKNLQIFLMVSKIEQEVPPKFFAQSLMEELHRNDFNRTSVVAYNNACKAIELTKSSKNKFKLNDISTVDRKYAFKKTADELHFKHGNKQSDNKIVFHNYSYTGKVEEIGYRDFKEKYMSGFNDEYKRSLNKVLKSFKNFKYKEVYKKVGEGEEKCKKYKKYNQDHLPQMELMQSKFEVQTLKDFLLDFSLSGYFDNYQQKSYHGIKHHHGKTGFNRIMCFHDRIAAISKNDIRDANDKDTLNKIANRIIVEIINFAKQKDEYSKFAGNSLFSRKINVNDNSGMTKILEGLQNFYKQMAGVNDNKLVNESLQKFQETLDLDTDLTNLSEKRVREDLLGTLKTLDSKEYETYKASSLIEGLQITV
ncbi:hypothetical protein EDC55_1167 [Allofrancisella inopinata]|uniref:Uncharacterized protein n=1 Tax=Allofrancisella inopinata TaxID=1085647 RepID=A0AAE7CRV1_9GAMM|nr:hypothetical protein [Allofrancisella inopinata]QIV96078.1 hypothetical protein E4K63_04245 [Allofrancisella inopinata]TDT69667.1 hypothetical protein EDC55_1167 [Allofrancisella inopinata]